MLISASDTAAHDAFGGRPFAPYLWQVSPLMFRDETLRAAFHFSHELGLWVLPALAVGGSLLASCFATMCWGAWLL